MANEPICVRHAGTVEEADLIVAWLGEHDVEATVVGRDSMGVHAFGITDAEGVAICVSDAKIAERAEALLAEHDAARLDEDSVGESSESTEVLCDECGELNSFSDDLCGTVQGCASCGAYLDVGTPDE